jgi:hypothetical protein
MGTRGADEAVGKGFKGAPKKLGSPGSRVGSGVGAGVGPETGAAPSAQPEGDWGSEAASSWAGGEGGVGVGVGCASTFSPCCRLRSPTAGRGGHSA